MALQWRQSSNALKAAKTLGEMLTTLALSYASPLIFKPRLLLVLVLLASKTYRLYLSLK